MSEEKNKNLEKQSNSKLIAFQSPEAHSSDQPTALSNGWIVLQHWHIYLFIIILVVLASRLIALGLRPLHHDESLFAYYSYYQLFKTFIYKYRPILHGPFMLHLNGLFYMLFGSSTYNLRFAVALMGAAMGLILIPSFRKQLGHEGMLATMTLFALSSTMIYYSRFFRHDIPLAFFILLSFLVALRAWQNGRRWTMFWATFLFLFPICVKENIFIYYMSFLSFFTLVVIVDLAKPELSKLNLICSIFRLKKPEVKKAPLKSSKKGVQSDAAAKNKTPTTPFFPNQSMVWVWMVVTTIIVYFGGWIIHHLMFEGSFLPFNIKTWFDPRLLTSNVDAIQKSHEILFKQGVLGVQEGSLYLKNHESLISPIWAWVFHILALPSLFFFILSMRWVIINNKGETAVLTRAWTLIRKNYVIIGLGISAFLIVYVLLFTTYFKYTDFKLESYELPPDAYQGKQLEVMQPRNILYSYHITWIYWYYQHVIHRIKGPFHFYLPILLMYELPALFLFIGGAFYAMWRRRGGKFMLILWGVMSILLLLLLHSIKFEDMKGSSLRLISLDSPDWHGEKFQSRWHFYYAFCYLFWGAVLPIHYLWRRERFLAWNIFWFFTSLFIYSWAGEKVPWVTVHIALPLLFCGGIFAHKLLKSTMFKRWRYVWIGLFAVFIIWNSSLAIKLNFYNYDNVVERLIYGHTQRDLRDVAYTVYDMAERSGERENYPIYMNGEALWMFYWYFRDYTNWSQHENLNTTKRPVVICNWDVAQANTNIKDNYTITKHSVRNFWQPKVLKFGRMANIWKAIMPKQYRKPESPEGKKVKEAKEEWKKLIDYIIYRKPFNPPDWQWDTVSSVDFAFCVRKEAAE